MLTNTQMVAAINAGQSVAFDGKSIRTLSELPSDAEIATYLARIASEQRGSDAGSVGEFVQIGELDFSGGDVTKVVRADGSVSVVTKTEVGLANVNNTADTAKPVSTAQAAADAAAIVSASADATSKANAAQAAAEASVAALNPLAGLAAGYKLARSAAPVALDGTNPTSVAHGLTTCVSAGAWLAGSAAPVAGTSTLSVNINGPNLDIYGWKPTVGGAGGNADLVASDGIETFHWIAIGT